MIQVRKIGGIWIATDDYFCWKASPPAGYGTIREEALGSLSRFLTTYKVTKKETQ